MLTPMKRLLFAIVLLSAARTAAARGMFSETFAVTEAAAVSAVSSASAETIASAVVSSSAEIAASAVSMLSAEAIMSASQCLPKLPCRVFVRFSRKPPYPLFLWPQVISSVPAFRLLLHLPQPPRRLPPLRLLPTDGPLRFSKNWLRDSVRWALTE